MVTDNLRIDTFDMGYTFDALMEVMGPDVRTWDVGTIAKRLLKAGYGIRRLGEREASAPAVAPAIAQAYKEADDLDSNHARWVVQRLADALGIAVDYPPVNEPNNRLREQLAAALAAPAPAVALPHVHEWHKEYAPNYRQASEADDYRWACNGCDETHGMKWTPAQKRDRLDVERLWKAIDSIGVIENGTWVSFERADAELIADEYARLAATPTDPEREPDPADS